MVLQTIFFSPAVIVKCMGNNLNMVISRYSEQILSELHFLRPFSDAPLAMVKTTLTKVSDTQKTPQMSILSWQHWIYICSSFVWRGRRKRYYYHKHDYVDLKNYFRKPLTDESFTLHYIRYNLNDWWFNVKAGDVTDSWPGLKSTKTNTARRSAAPL